MNESNKSIDASPTDDDLDKEAGASTKRFKAVSGLLQNPRLRGEMVWVLAHKGFHFVLQLVALKLMTSYLSKATYGEFQLAMTGLALLDYLLIAPMLTTYLRSYHTAQEQNSAANIGRFTLRWYAIVIGVVLVLGTVISIPVAGWVGFEAWTVAAAVTVFAANRCRFLGISVLNIQRRRKEAALQAIAFLALQLGFVAIALYVGWHSAAVILLTFTISAGLLCLFGFRDWMRSFATTEALNTTEAPKATSEFDIRNAITTYGIPFGLLMVCQWIQGFSDRYVLAAELGVDTAGEFIAAFQVCGVPFMLLWFLLDALMTPIMFQRAKDVNDPAQLRSAFRIHSFGVLAYVAVGSASIVGYFLFGQFLLLKLTSTGFMLPAATLALLALARFTQCLTFLLDQMFAVRKRMSVSLRYRIISACVAIPLLIWATSKGGLNGAIIGSLCIHTGHLSLQLFAPQGCLQMYRESQIFQRSPDATG